MCVYGGLDGDVDVEGGRRVCLLISTAGVRFQVSAMRLEKKWWGTNQEFVVGAVKCV